jgi:phospholipid-binding lipoprotein MlaA
MRLPLCSSWYSIEPARAPLAAVAVVAASLAAGAAHAANPPRGADPLEKLNRATYAFNDALDRMLARPAAKAYRKVVPETARNAISNAVANLEYPTTALNNALQGKFRDAGSDTLRFLVNSTIGIGGLADPATKFGLPANDEDFGQTLGHWGVPTGPYLVLPLLGPSNFRDASGRVADRYTNARHYIGAGSTELALAGVDVLDKRTSLLAADDALRRAFDPYALVRDAYLQRREYLVRDGDVPEPNYEDEPLEEPIPVDAPPEGGAEPPGNESGTKPEPTPPPAAAPPSDAPADPSTGAPPGTDAQAAAH